MCCCGARPSTRSELGRPSWGLRGASVRNRRSPSPADAPLAPCRYEKYDAVPSKREKTDDPFTDELNLVADKVQDLQLVSAH